MNIGLVMQRCSEVRTVAVSSSTDVPGAADRSPPNGLRSAGGETIWSRSRVILTLIPDFASRSPFVVVIVELAESRNSGWSETC